MAEPAMMLTLASWLHDLDPFLVKFSADFGVRWYGLSYVAGFVVAYVIILMLARRGLTRIPPERALDALLWLVFGTIAGGRLGYVLVYEPGLLVEFTKQAPWWGAIAINKGGMASHGGMVGLALASWRISRGWRGSDGKVYGKCGVLSVMDVVALAALPGIFFGRIANFLNGELLGRVVTGYGQVGPWWAVRYPQEVTSRWEELPAEQRDVVASAMGMPVAGRRIEPDTDLWYEFAGRYQSVVDHLRAGSVEAHALLGPMLNARHPSQLYQAFAESLVVAVVVGLVWWRRGRAGLAAAGFLVTYGVMRVLTEFVRLPDPQFGDAGRIAGLSRGQWLSVAMVVVGVVLAVWVMRAGKVGGGKGGDGSGR